jgi:hypothetical protein
LLFSVFSVLHLVLFCYGVPCFSCAGVRVTESVTRTPAQGAGILNTQM